MSNGPIFWIASYPKSGSTWVRSILSGLAAGDGKPHFDQIGKLCPNAAALRWIEEMLDVATGELTAAEHDQLRIDALHAFARSGSPPFWLKVHDRYDPRLIPPELTAGIVYLVRDPRDVAPSWADQLNVSLDRVIEGLCVSGFVLSGDDARWRRQARQRLGTWSDHVHSWLSVQSRPLLCLRYEDLLADTFACATRLARFLGLSASPELIAATVEACRFSALQQIETANGFRERLRHQQRFFRQGKSGSWRSALSARQASIICETHAETMALLGYCADGAVSCGSSGEYETTARGSGLPPVNSR